MLLFFGNGGTQFVLEVTALKLEETVGDDIYAQLLTLVSEEKRNRAGRFRFIKDAQRTVLGDVMARSAICRHIGVRNSEIVFIANRYGKPLLQRPEGIHFNIAHSGNWIVCALDHTHVGVDVEVIKPIEMAIAKRFFSMREYRFLMQQPESVQVMNFFKIWTLKESFIKEDGRGMSIPLDSFSILPEEADRSIRTVAEAEVGFYQTYLDSESVFALCTAHSLEPVSIRPVTPQSLIEQVL